LSATTTPGPSGPIPAKADTFLVSCIDPRLTDDTTFRFAALGRTDRYSEMRIAGGALAFVDNNRPAWQAALWENLAASRQLHGIRNVTLLNHRDCGAMNLWAGRRLGDDPAEETRLHVEVLNAAADAIRARHPDLLIEIKLMELDGTVVRPTCRSCIPPGFLLGAMGADGLPTLDPDPLAPLPPPGEPRIADIARLRRRRGALDAEAEFALLEQAVTEEGLSVDEARAALAETGAVTAQSVQRDVLTYLRSQADRRGRIDQRALTEAAGLYRGLQGSSVTMPEAKRATARIATEAGFTPRPSGWWPFRSTRWFTRLTA
jgi:hypothetical protein